MTPARDGGTLWLMDRRGSLALLALAGGFQKDFALLLKVYGRTTESKALDSKKAKEGRSTVWGSAHENDHDMA